MYPKFWVIFPNFTPPTRALFMIRPEGFLAIFFYGEVPHMVPAKYRPNPPGGSGEEDF